MEDLGGTTSARRVASSNLEGKLAILGLSSCSVARLGLVWPVLWL